MHGRETVSARKVRSALISEVKSYIKNNITTDIAIGIYERIPGDSFIVEHILLFRKVGINVFFCKKRHV